MTEWVRQTVLFGRQDKLSTVVKSRKSFSLITRATRDPIFRDFFLHQVQEGLVRLSKEHLCSEGGLPLSGLLILPLTGSISSQTPLWQQGWSWFCNFAVFYKLTHLKLQTLRSEKGSSNLCHTGQTQMLEEVRQIIWRDSCLGWIIRVDVVIRLSSGENPCWKRGFAQRPPSSLPRQPGESLKNVKHFKKLWLTSPFKVWDRAEKLYRKFCEKRAAGGLPPLAVLLSILWSSRIWSLN